MPRSPSTKTSNRSNPVGETDAVLRKKKNADAQAAFRQRRANYITTLEETVTSLESAVMQLQESCREVQVECADCKRENDRLRQQLREREKFWRDMWQNNRRSTSDTTGEVSAYPSTPSDSLPAYVYAQADAYSTEALSYKAIDDPCYNVRAPQPYQASSTPYTATATGVSADDSLSRRNSNKFTYQYTLSESGADSGAWGAAASSSRTDVHAVNTTGTSHTTTFAEQAAPQLNSFGYVDHRSSSPLSPTSSTTAPMYSFSNTDVVTSDRDFDIRRHSGVSCSDMMLQGSGADLALASSSGDASRYRMGAPYTTNSERTMLPGFASLADNSVHYGHAYEDQTKRRSLTSVSSAPTVPASSSTHTSRSPSPGGSPPLSSTIAVLKAQSFGALRRSRTRRRKSSDSASKGAMDSQDYREGSDDYEGV